MALTPDNPSKAPGHTCPAIDRTKRTLRRCRRILEHEDHERLRGEIDQALADLEELRAANQRLRKLASR